MREDESPEECVRREVREEAGLELEGLRLRGILTFILPDWGNELTFLYTARAEDRELPDCDEGELRWIRIEEAEKLPLWEGDRIFLPLLRTREDCFSLKLVYAPGGDLERWELTP
jgi:8-oxo-dGTP diphosphatase